MIQGSNAGRDKIFFSSPEYSDRLWAKGATYLMSTKGSICRSKAARG
jgi:hypothetical protein